MMRWSDTDVLMLNVSGVAPIMKDIDNNDFTDYVANNIASLTSYARRLENVDPFLAEDLVCDLWASYHLNEEDGKCYSCAGGNAEYTSIDVAVKTRLQLMAKKRDKDGLYVYQKNSKGSKVISAHFTEADTEDDDLQRVLSNKAAETSSSIDELVFTDDIKDQMLHFIACTSECVITGETILDTLDSIVDSIHSNEFGTRTSDVLKSLFCIGDMKDTFASILHTFTSDRDSYYKILTLAKEEYDSCRQLLVEHPLEVEKEREACRQLLANMA